MTENQMLTPHALAARWKITVQTLYNWRVRKVGPPFVRIGMGPRARVLYRLDDVMAFEALKK